MTAKIIKFQFSHSSNGTCGYYQYRVKLPKEVVEMLGGKIHIRKFSSHYELSRFGEVQEGRVSMINKSNWLTMPSNLVQEFEDVGEYDIDLDFENECVNMVRK